MHPAPDPFDPLSRLLADTGASEAAAPDPIELLGWMLQLRGTVSLCAFLDELELPARPAGDPLSPAGEPLWRLRHIRALALRPLRSPLSGRRALAGAARAREALAEIGLVGRRRRGAVDRLADELAGEFHDGVGHSIAIARSGVAELRGSLAEWLRSMGPAAATLERIDAATRELTEERARQLFARLAPALHQRFRDELWAAVRRLPAELTPEIIDAWYEAGGWIDEHVELCRQVVGRACRIEGRALETLVDAIHGVAILPEEDT